MTKYIALLAMLMLAIGASRTSYAQVPLMINYQGKLEMSGSAYNGTGYFKFALIDNATTPTTNYWTNDGSTVTAGAEPTSAVTLPVNLGLFSVKLGNTSLTNMTVLPTSAFTNSTLYLRVWFSADGVVFEQLNPDRQLVSAPYAIHADSADSITGNIADANISATAAIAGSKVIPNFGSQALTAGNGSFSGLSAGTGTFTGLTTGTLSASTTLGIPTSSAPVLSTDGEIALKSGSDAINIQAGSATTGGIPAHTDVAIPLIQQKDITLLQPDQIQVVSDAIPFITVDSFNYPNGITITAIRLATSASSSLAINVENWASPTDGAPVTISNIATSSSTEQTNTTITNPVVAAGSYVFLNLDTTVVNWAKVTIWYYVNN